LGVNRPLISRQGYSMVCRSSADRDLSRNLSKAGIIDWDFLTKNLCPPYNPANHGLSPECSRTRCFGHAQAQAKNAGKKRYNITDSTTDSDPPN